MRGQAVNYKRSWKNQHSVPVGENRSEKTRLRSCAVRLVSSVRWITDSCKAELGAVCQGSLECRKLCCDVIAAVFTTTSHTVLNRAGDVQKYCTYNPAPGSTQQLDVSM